MRCFVSIELPENVKSQIFHAFERLQKSQVCFGNFVNKDSLHLTLKFLGHVPAEKIEEIKKSLKEIDFRQFPVETGKVGFFPNEKYVKTLWIDLISSDFEFLKKEIDEKLQRLGFNEDEKKFTTHITVARIKGIKDKQVFFNKLNEVAPRKMFFIVNQFSLVKSILKGKRPEYKTLGDFQMRMRS